MKSFYIFLLLSLPLHSAYAFYTNSPARTGVYTPTIEQDPNAQPEPDLYQQQPPLTPPAQGTIITPNGPFKTTSTPKGQTMAQSFMPSTPGISIGLPPETSPPPPHPSTSPQRNFMQVPDPSKPSHEGFNPSIRSYPHRSL